jgi:hypothetical protein
MQAAENKDILLVTTSDVPVSVTFYVIRCLVSHFCGSKLLNCYHPALTIWLNDENRRGSYVDENTEKSGSFV